MKIAGFNFTKINAEKKNNSFENLKIDTNMDISEVKEVSTDFFKAKEELVSFEFTFSLDYSPDVAKIELKGVIILALDSKLVKDILKQWKDKQLPPDFRLELLNIILRKSTLKCFQLEEELNLPLHIRLPRLTQENPSQENNLPENNEQNQEQEPGNSAP